MSILTNFMLFLKEMPKGGPDPTGPVSGYPRYESNDNGLEINGALRIRGL